MVLGGIIAAPLLIATGAVLAYRGKKLRRQARSDAEHLDAAEEALTHLTAAVLRAGVLAARAEEFLDKAAKRGALERKWMQENIVEIPSQVIQWDNASPQFQKRFNDITSLVVMVFAVLSLPIFPGIVKEDEGADVPENVDEWNSKVLDAAMKLVAKY